MAHATRIRGYCASSQSFRPKQKSSHRFHSPKPRVFLRREMSFRWIDRPFEFVSGASTSLPGQEEPAKNVPEPSEGSGSSNSAYWSISASFKQRVDCILTMCSTNLFTEPF